MSHRDDEYFKRQDEERKEKIKIIKKISKKLEDKSLIEVDHIEKIISNLDNIQKCLNLLISNGYN